MQLTTQRINGGNTKTIKVGYLLAELRHEQDRISIDDFKDTVKATSQENYKKYK